MSKIRNTKQKVNKKVYDENFDAIHWRKNWCAWCGEWCDHTSGDCEDLKNATKYYHERKTRG